MASQATSLGRSTNDPPDDTRAQQQSNSSVLQSISALQDTFRQEQQRREEADKRIACQLEELIQVVHGRQGGLMTYEEKGSSLPSDPGSQEKSSLATDAHFAALDESCKALTARCKELATTISPLAPVQNIVQSRLAAEVLESTSFEPLIKQFSHVQPNSADDSPSNTVESCLRQHTSSRSRSSSLSSIVSSRTSTSHSSLSQPSPDSTPSEIPRTGAASVLEETVEANAEGLLKRLPRRSSLKQFDQVTLTLSQQDDSTVEVIATKAPSTSRKGDRYTEFENDFIGKTVQKLCREGMTCPKALKQATAQLGKKGYYRSPGAVTVYWYTKLQHSYPLQPAKDNKDDSVESDEVVNPSGKADALHEENEQDRNAGSKSSTAGLESKMSDLVAKHPPVPQKPFSQRSSSSSLLATRLGDSCTTRRPKESATKALRAYAGRRFAMQSAWTGASNDILDCAWSPDGTQYILGAAVVDEHPYNRPNNLLLGNIVRNELREIPGHRESNASNPTLQDPCTYHTVGSVNWSGENVYTAGYDGAVQVWDAYNPTRKKYSMEHDLRVEAMAVSNNSNSLVATATDSGPDSLRLYPDPESGRGGFCLSLPRKPNNTLFSYTPMCMEFGASPRYSNHLLAGFGSNSTFDDGSPSPRGFLGLWRIDEGKVNRIRLNPCGQQVFDVAWAQQSNIFISGNTIGRRIGGVGATLVRIYDCGRSDVVQEAPCPALDMNDVSICPFDEKIFSAACTNNNTYVFDMRHLRLPLHTLQHGLNVSGHTSQLKDTGVRVVQWGNSRSEFFTGGSDGVLSLWDIRQGPADALTEHVVSSGIELMCGKLSPDKTSFLLGDASGSLQILTRSPSRDDDHPEDIDFIYSRSQVQTTEAQDETTNEVHKGREAAQELLATGQIVIDPIYGPGQGPRYEGPFAAWARPSDHGQKSLGDVPLLPRYAELQRFHASKAKDSGMKRTRGDVDFAKPSKKLSFKIRKLNSSVSTTAEKQYATSFYGQGIHEAKPVFDNIITGDSSAGREAHSDWDAHFDNPDEISDTDDDGYIPPHWMVDANLVKSVPD